MTRCRHLPLASTACRPAARRIPAAAAAGPAPSHSPPHQLCCPPCHWRRRWRRLQWRQQRQWQRRQRRLAWRQWRWEWRRERRQVANVPALVRQLPPSSGRAHPAEALGLPRRGQAWPEHTGPAAQPLPDGKRGRPPCPGPPCALGLLSACCPLRLCLLYSTKVLPSDPPRQQPWLPLLLPALLKRPPVSLCFCPLI